MVAAATDGGVGEEFIWWQLPGRNDAAGLAGKARSSEQEAWAIDPR